MSTVIAEIFVREKIRTPAFADFRTPNFRTARAMLQTLVYVYGFRMLKNVVLSAKSTKYEIKLCAKISAIPVKDMMVLA